MVGPEYKGPNRVSDKDELTDAEERLVARVTHSIGADTVAVRLHDAVTEYDLSGAEHAIRHWESPTGGVTADAVRAYYEDNPDKQPTDGDGGAFIPPSWDPTHHTIEETND